MGLHWSMIVPISEVQEPPGAVGSYPQCTDVRLFEALLSDVGNFGNGSMLPADSYGQQFYHSGLSIGTAKRLSAFTQLRTIITHIQKWFQDLNNGKLIYENLWGLLCVIKQHNGEEDPTCFGSNHVTEYGQMLNGVLRLWEHLIDDEESPQEKTRLQVKLEQMARTLARNIANLAESDEYFPIARGFDWFTGMAYDRHGFIFEEKTSRLREATPTADALLAYQSVALLGTAKHLRDNNMFLTGELLYSLQAFSSNQYIFKAVQHETDRLGVAVTLLREDHSVRSSDVARVLAPFDYSNNKVMFPFILQWQNALTAIHGADNTAESLVEQLAGNHVTPDSTYFDLMLLSTLEPDRALGAHITLATQGLQNYTNSSADTQAGDLEYLLTQSPAGYDCGTGGYTLPIRVLGTTVWYNDSFNYLFKTMDYQPTVIGQKVTTYNIYDMDLYGEILRRDVRAIKGLGFNTIMISTNTFSVDSFLDMCKGYDMNVIVSQILPEAGFATEKYIAEDDFTTMVKYLAGHTNIVMWSITSDALSNVNDAYNYYVLLRKLRLLRDTYDKIQRPIVIPLTEFTVPKLTADKTLYDKAVEMASITTMEANRERLTETITYLGHPVMITHQSDSWNHVNKTDEETRQSAYLKQEIEEVLPLHALQLLSGITVTEYVDQYWRGESSDPDFDCPDPSAFRHSSCGTRVAEFHDGMLTAEYMGINSQYQTWFKHCIRHKDAYYMLRTLMGGTADPGDNHEDCVFVNLTWDFWVFVIIASGALFAVTLLLVVMALLQQETSADDAYGTVEDEEQARWVQPDTDKIYELIMSGTSALLEQKPFVEMNIQRLVGMDDDMDVNPAALEEEEEFELDSWEFCRWQVVIIQVDRLQKIIFDEMLCQIKLGDYAIVGEHAAGFAHAVDSLHARYTNTYLGWLDHQTQKDERTRDRLGLTNTHIRWEIKFLFDEEASSHQLDFDDDMPYIVPLLPDEEEIMDINLEEGTKSFDINIKGIDYKIRMDEHLDEFGCVTGRVYEETQFPDDDDEDDEDAEGDMAEDRLLLVGQIAKRQRCGLGETTNDKLVDLLAIFCLWQLGEQMTWFNGHWLAWCFHYVIKHLKFPSTTIINDARHFNQRTVTMDDIDESCSITPYFDIEGTRGLDERENVLVNKDGTFNEEEIKRFPFRKTFREPLRWGIVFAIVHNIYFIVQTQVISFFFWGFVVNVSGQDQRLADLGISGMFERMNLVFFESPHDLYWILTMTSKIDFYLVLIGEFLDLWMIGGLYHYSRQDWQPTFVRVHFSDYVKLRWSAYTSVIAFIILMGETFYLDKNTVDGWRILAYVGIRVLGILVNNLVLVMFPVKQRGAPRKGQTMQRKGALRQFLFALLFWALVYGSVQLFQAWVMFRTETIGWSFCGCYDDFPPITSSGGSDFVGNFLEKMYSCADKEPRCFTAVFLIWVSSMAMFVIVVNAGFLVWVVIFGSFTHFATQWTSKKTRTLTGKKIQTAYILRCLNVKMLGFTDPRDTQVARKVWNRIIKEMWDEWLISAFEYENLLIHSHVSEVQFTLRNDFAMERLSNFLQYIQALDEEELGPCSSYPSISIVIPVYGEDLVCAAANTTGAFNEKIRSHQQEFTQLSFLVESYHDEWVNFVEHCVLEEEFFEEVLEEEQIDQMQQNVEELKDVNDEKQKREMRGDKELRNKCADIINDRIHTQPHLFYEEELIAVQWWASMHMQTVARTVRGMERKREAFRFLLELEQGYTNTEKTRQDKIDLLTDDKVQIVLALQNLANNKWFTKNENGLMLIWEKFPKVEVSFVIETLNYRNSPAVVRKVHEHVEDLWDCTKYLSCLALWSDELDDWMVVSAYARRNTLRLEKNARYGLNGALQGKAVNQHHSLAFTRGQLIEAIDCNQDGYFDEALKMRTVLGKFFPTGDRTWSQYKIVGFPEYSITQKSGVIGRIASYSEYIFVNMFQKVLAHPLNVRMHYGHPDFFDFSWCIQQGGMSKSNPLINLNEDIFAGFHVTHAGERVDHVMWMRDGKGRETNFDGANGFQIKLAFGASMQFRTRDQYELMRTSDVLRRHSILYGSVGPYIYLITIVVLIYTTLLINISLAYANKTDYSLSSKGSPYGSEWMVQMSLIESVPLLCQLTLDYGLVGLFTFIRDVLPTTLYFLFIIMTRFSYFIQSCLNGSAAYIATGRTDPLFRRSLRHMFRYYGSTHFMPGLFLLAIVILYIDVEPRGIVSSLLRTFWHWGVAVAFIVTPCVFNPSLNLSGVWEDLKAYYLWVFGDIMEKIKKQKDVLTKRVVKEKKDAFWEKAYEQLAMQLHPANQGGDGLDKRGMSNLKQMYHGAGDDHDRLLSGVDDGEGDSQPGAINFRFRDYAEFGDEVSTDSSEDYLPQTYPWTDEYDIAASKRKTRSPSFGDDDLEPVEFSTLLPGPPPGSSKYAEQSAPPPRPIYVGTILKKGSAGAALCDKALRNNRRAPSFRYAQHAMPPKGLGVAEPDEVEMPALPDFDELPPPPPAEVAEEPVAMDMAGLPPPPMVEITKESDEEESSDPPAMMMMELPPEPPAMMEMPPPLQEKQQLQGGAMHSSAPSLGSPRKEGSEADLVLELPTGSFLQKPRDFDELSSSITSNTRGAAPCSVLHPIAVNMDLPNESSRTGANSSSSRLNIPPPSSRPPGMGDSSATFLSAMPGQTGHGRGSFMSVSRSDLGSPLTPLEAGQHPVSFAHPLQAERVGGPAYSADQVDETVANQHLDQNLFERGTDEEDLSESFMSSLRDDRRGGARIPSLHFQGMGDPGAGRSSRTYRAGMPLTARAPVTARLVADKAVADKKERWDDTEFNFEWLEKNEKNKADLEKYLKAYRLLQGNVRGASTHGGKVPNKTVEWKAMQTGFMKLGKIVDDANCKELLLGLGVQEIDFVQFVILYHKAEGQDSGHGDYGIDRAVTDINRARHRELRHIQKQMARGRKGYLKTRNEAQKIAVLTVLHNTRRQFKVQFRDSTEDKSLVKANSLKHHWKVSQILSYRRSSTVSGLFFSMLMFAAWCFAYFALWQDIFWEVFYFVLAFTWDYLLSLSNIGPVVLFTRACIAVFIVYRIIVMLQVDNIFFPTIVMTYAFVHVFIDLQFSFWACLGPYLMCRKVRPGKENPKTIDEQREACLISLLLDKREHYLWGFPYYFFARQLLAVIIGLIQFLFTIVLLIVRSVWEGLCFLADMLSNSSHRKNPTEGTYIADKNNFLQEDECRGPPVNRWTNTATPATSNKQCQVTNPNVKNEFRGGLFGGLGGVGMKSAGTDAALSPGMKSLQSPHSNPRSPNGKPVDIDDLPAPPELSNLLSKPNRPMPVSLFGNKFLSPQGPKRQKDDDELSVVEFGGGGGGDADTATSDNMFAAADAMLQSELVYFGDGENVNYVLCDAFQTMSDFRKGIKTFYRFLGPLSQVTLELMGEELLDTDEWPIETSKMCHVHITLQNMYAQREKRKAVHAARSELRGMTDLENRLATHQI
eukprot:TRINITY_DN3013_c2_g1_i1.p1 TRINITY_DN3013_c2_g1~~TRINITY_DN3013_c2_g1_i1.p1  ORF type:complete len:3869 (+),score=1632.68 TRINITY_DN3013_c2_g1_i1:1187-11608(+)